MAKGLTGIEYGKLKVYGETDMSEVLKTFAIIMKKFGYPEEEPEGEFDVDEDETEEDIVNELKEDAEAVEQSQPWTKK